MNQKINKLLADLYLAYQEEDKRLLDPKQNPIIFTHPHLEIWNAISRAFITERIEQIRKSPKDESNESD